MFCLVGFLFHIVRRTSFPLSSRLSVYTQEVDRGGEHRVKSIVFLCFRQYVEFVKDLTLLYNKAPTYGLDILHN